jgi:hypothetical protein
MPRLTQAEEDALAAQMEADADDPDAWGEPVYSPPRTWTAGLTLEVSFPGPTARRIYDHADRLEGDIIELVRVYVERGLDQDDAAEAAQARAQSTQTR